MDIGPEVKNHHKMQLTDTTQWSGYQIGRPDIDRRLTLEELQDWLADAVPGRNMPYYNKKGELKSKPGYSVVRIDHHAPVLSGGGGFYDNHWIYDEDELYYRPLTMRERLRIQGFEDDFVLTPDGFDWGSKEHRNQIKQTGKCMPVQFPREFARQLFQYLGNGVTLDLQPSRLLKQV